jgi:hypothetical protein
LTATLGNSWANLGGAFFAAACRLQGNVVEGRGLIGSGADNSSPFTLPVGMRPSKQVTMALGCIVDATGVAATATGFVLSTGSFVVRYPGPGYDVGLESFRFTVD